MTGLTREHEIHRRRMGRNVGLGLVLAGLVAIILGLTVVKVTLLDPAQNGVTPAPAEETGQ